MAAAAGGLAMSLQARTAALAMDKQGNASNEIGEKKERGWVLTTAASGVMRGGPRVSQHCHTGQAAKWQGWVEGARH